MSFSKMLLVLCMLPITINAQTHSRMSDGVQMTSGQDAQHAKLQLTTSIVEHQYCSDGRLRFTLGLNFTNLAGETIILDKRSSLVPKYMVSRNAAAALAKKYKDVGNVFLGIGARVTDDVMTLSPTLDESRFIVLRTGESYLHNEPFSLHLYDGTSDSFGTLRPGDYVLQIVVLTWNYPAVSNIEARKKWQQKGYLWSDSVTSLPMPFSVAKKRTVVDCSRFIPQLELTQRTSSLYWLEVKK